MEVGLNIFKTHGEPVVIEGNKPFLLDGADAAWLVESGKVDLFAVRVHEGETAGVRHHLLRFEQGQALFSIPADASDDRVGLLVVGSIGTKVSRIPLPRLRELARGEASAEVAGLLDAWLCEIARGARRGSAPKQIDTELIGGKKALRRPGKNCRPAKGAVWVQHLDGKSYFLGREQLGAIEGEAFFPVTEQSWLEGEEKAQLRVASTAEWLKEDPDWKGLDKFHACAMGLVRMGIGLALESGAQRFRKKKETDQQFFRAALSRLSAILNPEMKIGDEETADPVLAACRAVGKAIGVELRAPVKRDVTQPLNVDDIMKASNVRQRVVALHGEWWREDNGPLVGTVDETKQPAALLPTGLTGYEIYEPATGRRETVTAKIAATLSPFAHMIYRPFPPRAIGGVELVRFGLRGLRRDFVTLLLIGAAGGILGLAIPLATGVIIDQVIPAAQMGMLGQVSLAMLAAALATAAFGVTRSVAMLRMEGRIDQGLQSAVWDRLLNLPVSFFRKYSAGELAARAMGVNSIRAKLSGATVASVLAGVFSMFSFFLLFYYSPALAVVATLLVAFAVLFIGVASYLQIRHQRRLIEIEGNIQGFVFEFLTGISKFRVAGAEGRAFAFWAKNFAEQKGLAYSVGKATNVIDTFTAVFPVAGSIVIFFALTRLSTEASPLSTGQFLAFNAAYVQFLTAMLSMAATLVGSLDVIPLYERSRPIIESVPEVDEGKTPCGELLGEIEVSHVSFQYAKDGPFILDDVSIHVRPGEFAALIGPSGSGKSTLFRLMLAFEHPGAGSIYYDGQDLAGLDIRSVRQNMGVVLQNAQIMAGSIFENIVGASKLTLDDAWEAARMAGLDKDVEAMPMGMHTVISQGGGTLSGGQRQRLLIARAVASKPRVLFFDEATSALDNKTQAIVSQSLERLKTTRIVIAHRLSTVMNADRIFVLKNGQVAESGSYKELMERQGLFAELAKRQIA